MENQSPKHTEAKPWHRTYEKLSYDLPLLVETPLSSIVEEIGHQYPDAPALAYMGRVISYAELDALANRLAHVFLELGLKPGDTVGINMPNIPQYVVAMLAAWKTGCAVSGVSPLLTPPEIVYQINDADIRILVTLDVLATTTLPKITGQVPGLLAVIITGVGDLLSTDWQKAPGPGKNGDSLIELSGAKVESFLAAMASASDKRVYTPVNFDDTIFIQYTGGTTGKPKGAQLTLGNMLSNTGLGGAFLGFEKDGENVFSAFPLFHVAGLFVGLLTLRNRGCYHLFPDPRNIEHIVETMRQSPPTLMCNVPTLYQMLMDHPGFAQLDFSKLKIGFSGAAPFPMEQMEKLEAIIGKGRVVECYGMTETSPMITVNPPGFVKQGTVGIPVFDTDVKILDVETKTIEVPLGEPGELAISGPQVMKGYRHLPAETARSMREIDGERWFLTGDVAMMDQDGYVTICDRSKDMLIVGGYKVFSVEVEGKLAELPFVELAAVVGAPDPKRPGNDLVNLFVQLTEQGKSENRDGLIEEIMVFCKENMAPYKVPKRIEIIEQIPLTPIGKIDKKRLRAALAA